MLFRKQKIQLTTWRKLIKRELGKQCETWDDIEYCTLDDDELDYEFDSDYGSEQGQPFTVWTECRVYFPVCYDGAQWVGSVARHPNGSNSEVTYHHGGG